ncbi:DUF805 domain-containing protein [Weissella muntiaci]|uniref:DUF805 domain-containing protein n=1 Tax=Weissella muntiaci TaxID=2508881 RepID=A0A6C2CA08_9LACO|nr:DUF805 domain-containing protein [Weissella muntiaci]TYC50970.1 DUF805 domain-containing protein [Weissella muntiaci]
MFEYYADFWKNYVNFTGTASRSQYWYAYLWNAIIIALLVAAMLGGALVTGSFSESSAPIPSIIAIVILGLFLIALIIPNLSITIRRLRDGGFHWAFIFLGLIPYVGIFGSFVIFIFTLMPTKVVVRQTEVIKVYEVQQANSDDENLDGK